MQRNKMDDFWKLSARSGILPRETRDYVPMVLAAIVIVRDPAQYGCDLDTIPAPRHDLVELPRPVDLRRIAEWADATTDEIQALNPELRRWTTPVRDDTYEIRVPFGTGDLVSQCMLDAPDTELASLRWYTVKRGDTLATIARDLKTSRTDLAEANFLKTNARVAVGDRLIVPQEPSPLMAARPDRPAVDSPPAQVETLARASTLSEPEQVRVVYQVRRGDTLTSIARAFKTTVRAIQGWNGMTGSRIVAGDHLTLFAAVRGN